MLPPNQESVQDAINKNDTGNSKGIPLPLYPATGFLINLVHILYDEQWHLYTPSVHSSQATVRGPKIDISAEPCPNKLIGDSPSVKGDSKQPLRCSSCSTGLS